MRLLLLERVDEGENAPFLISSPYVVGCIYAIIKCKILFNSRPQAVCVNVFHILILYFSCPEGFFITFNKVDNLYVPIRDREEYNVSFTRHNAHFLVSIFLEPLY